MLVFKQKLDLKTHEIQANQIERYTSSYKSELINQSQSL